MERPALVIGSAQSESVVDHRALAEAGVELVKRRSGGGAVLLVPGQVLWVDVEIPREDPWWDEDVGQAFHWLGRYWAQALAALGLDATVNLHSLRDSPWSRRVCFAGLGPGEVSVAGRKVVGMSQRRTRSGARFQCLVLRRWDPSALLSLLALDVEERQRAQAELQAVAAGVDLPPEEVADAFAASLRSDRA